MLRNLSVAMTEVRSFVKDNRKSLTSNISGLNRISKTLVKQRDALDKTLQYAPAALNNLYLAGNVKQGTLDTRDVAGELLNELGTDPVATLCTIVGQADGGSTCDLITGALQDAARRSLRQRRTRRAARGRTDRPVHGWTSGGAAMRARMSAVRRRTASLLVGLLAGVLVLSGCSVYDVPLPGGADTGKNPMQLTLMFRDVLDLVPQSTVKLDDVTVGKVKSIKLKGYVAEVKVEIPGDVKLPENTTAADSSDQPPGREVHRPRPAGEPRQRHAVEQRRHRARPHGSQP